MTQSYRLQHLFQKYLHNNCSPEEVEELVGLINDAEPDELDTPMKALWEKSKASHNNHVNWQKMLNEVVNSEESLVTIHQNKKRNFRKLWINAAAAAVLLAVLSVGINYYLYKYSAKAKLTYVESSVPLKKTQIILLEDGSKITLNAGSSLRYPESFNGKTREVYLEGEALFNVAHDVRKPFIVHSGQLKTQVLGTSFNISAYPGAEKMEVTVISGKVAVEETASKRHTMLVSNQKVVYNLKKNLFTTTDLQTVTTAVAWQDGRIGFDDASLTEVAAQFYRRYGIRLILGSPNLSSCRISIVLNNDNVDNLLKTITSLTNSSYRYHGGDVIISGEGCN